MYRYTQILPGGAITLFGVLGLSLLMPGWVAPFLGLGAAHSYLFVWLARQQGIAPILFWLCYGAAGFCMLVAAAIGAYTAFIAAMRGLATVMMWGVRAGQAIAKWLARLLYWPVQLFSELVWDHCLRQAADLEELIRQQHELRRLYREEYAAQYPSFRAFLRDWRALNSGDQTGANGEPDPLQNAIKLMGLPQQFTKDELKRRFQKLISAIHPDKVGPNELATQLIAANTLIHQRKAWQ
jgi:hypothetical protein